MAKKKKASSSGKSIGAKGFLVLHIEKIVFAIIAILSLALVYLGMSGDKIASSKNPADLKKKAEVTLASVVNDSHWEQIAADAGRTHADSFIRVTNPIDGVEWKELPNTPWKPRHAASLVVHNGVLWMIAGNNMEPDVWRLERK